MLTTLVDLQRLLVFSSLETRTSSRGAMECELDKTVVYFYGFQLESCGI